MKDKDQAIEEEVLVEEELVLDPLVEALKAKDDQLLRLTAEFANFKKRSQKEREEAYANAKAQLLKAFLPVMDNFERAALSGAEEEDCRKGMEMIFAQFCEVFAALGAEAFGAAGEAFDPLVHSAVVRVEDSEHESNTIAEVFLKGWRVKDRVLRDAMVGVAD